MANPKSRKDTVFKRRPTQDDTGYHVLPDGSHLKGTQYSEETDEAIEDLAIVESRRKVVWDQKRALILEDVRHQLGEGTPVYLTDEMKTFDVLDEVLKMIADAEAKLRFSRLVSDDDDLFLAF